MSGFILRIIAMATMLIDHIGWNFLDNPMLMTWIGRIAFLLYAFLLAEGFLIICKDKNRLNKHLAIMLILAVVSEIGYDPLENRLNFAEYLDSQSNMLTLLIGYTGMLITEMLIPSVRDKAEKITKTKIAALVCTYILLGFANYMLKGNFNIVGPLLIMAFYWYIRTAKAAGNGENLWPWGKRIAILLAIIILYLVPYFWVRSGFGNPGRWWEEVVNYAPWIVGHVIAAVIISLYNGKLGYHKKWFKRLYLVFYPVHAFVIGVVCILIGR